MFLVDFGSSEHHKTPQIRRTQPKSKKKKKQIATHRCFLASFWVLFGPKKHEKSNPKSSCEKVSFWALIFADLGALGIENH